MALTILQSSEVFVVGTTPANDRMDFTALMSELFTEIRKKCLAYVADIAAVGQINIQSTTVTKRLRQLKPFYFNV